jgi:isoleucyl-tRNA synthetase
MISPILAFTADEAWGFVPGRLSESVHLAAWVPSKFEQSAEEREQWKSLFEFREAALTELEKARQAKTIGKALDARLKVSVPQGTSVASADSKEILRELLNVSQLEFEVKEGPVTVEVAKADGAKCERCWHYETTVGGSAAHPTLCDRCVSALPAKT